MRNLILTFLVLLITGPAFCEDAEKTKLPDDAVSALADFDKAVAAKTKELRAKLEKAQEAATKKGNLDGALAVKAAIEKLPPVVKVAAVMKPDPLSTSKRVILYALADFKGPSYTVAASEIDVVLDAYRVGFPNDALRSLRLPTGYTLTVYAAEQAGGASHVITSESADLTGTPAFTIGMSSFMVSKTK